MKKVEECYLKDLYAQAGLEKDREQGNAIGRLHVLKLIQEEEVNGNPDQIDKEPGHYKKIKKTRTRAGYSDHMTSGTEKIIWKIECIETITETTEVQK